MARSTSVSVSAPPPAFRDVVELIKPITWFPPMWAFMCGVVSSGVSLSERWPFLVAGIVLAGPLVCGTSQAVNDWFDRHVDAINEPGRPIPSGRIAGQWGLYVAIIGTVFSLLVGAAIGLWVFLATCLGLLLAWGYSAPPWRLKVSGWIGPAACALCYEGLTWFTGAAVMIGGLPSAPILAVLLLYSAGAHGIMTLNDFKAIEGDREMGIRSLPVTLGPDRAARLACAIMALPQIAVVGMLFAWGLTLSGGVVAGLLAAQIIFMRKLLSDPRAFAPWYNMTGVSAYVFGMLAAAIGLGSLQ